MSERASSSPFQFAFFLKALQTTNLFNTDIPPLIISSSSSNLQLCYKNSYPAVVVLDTLAETMKKQRETLLAVLCSGAVLCSARAATDNNHLSPHMSSPSNPVAPSPENNSTKHVVLGIVIGSCALGVLAAVIVLPWIFYCYSKREDEKNHNRNSGHHLVSIGGCDLGFDMEDLLRASAEVLGKGTLGTTYKAALEGGTSTVVVKRLNDVCVGREEFQLQMEVSGSIRHENVAPLKAYYYSDDEKLTVHDYYSQGSVSAMHERSRECSSTDERINLHLHGVLFYDPLGIPNKHSICNCKLMFYVEAHSALFVF